ncbi:hypothetical protein [Streptomyces fagopyri]|uniref:hypothetical protein n=1 Tax=Streptomyces fagopyri TaxID=2662397 RepID=UPI0033DAE22C
MLDTLVRYGAPRSHACFADDANYLAHVLSSANRHSEVAEVFDAIGPGRRRRGTIAVLRQGPVGVPVDMEAAFERLRSDGFTSRLVLEEAERA